MAELGLSFPEDRFYAMGGIPTARIIRILAAEQNLPLDLEQLPQFVQRKEDYFLGAIQSIRPVEKVFQLAAACRGVYPLAVASGGYRRVVEQTLNVLQCRDWFQAVVCAEDTTAHKPAPDVFLETARRLGVPAEQCVVFEDTDIGLEAGRRAGMPTVDIRAWDGFSPGWHQPTSRPEAPV
jgi:beta-phosphoglucomutase-like phosphatase (HAD superfamily)